MEVLRYKYIFILLTTLIAEGSNNQTKHNITATTPRCPFTKIIEDVFKIQNKTTDKDLQNRDRERVKQFLTTIANISNQNLNKNDENLVNIIIDSIKRIKNSISQQIQKPNEASIETKNTDIKKVNQIKSGIEDKFDDKKADKKQTTKTLHTIEDITEKPEYIEVLTIDPTNPKTSTSNNFIEVLKHLMPLFNSTLTKKVHNITIIEKDRNNSLATSKNVSQIIVTYCDKDNSSNINITKNIDDNIKESDENDNTDDYYDDETLDDVTDEGNTTIGLKTDILEAAEYGMKKMHELYSVLEPKLYSMGLWLDDSNPARYVAAFNAPSEEAEKYSRYGYASLQAATKLKQLTSGGDGENLESRTEETQFPTASALRQSPLMQHCPLKGIPKCPPASKRYRTHDGTCNNLSRTRWGSTMTPVQRFLPPSYSDSLQAPRRSTTGRQLPSAREISASVHKDKDLENTGVTHLLMQWGQFLDHDVTSSSQSRGFNGSVPRCCKDGGKEFVPKELMHPECFPIAVPSSDPFYGPRGIRCLDFVRSSPAPRDDCALGWREQLNQVSAYIDGSPLYGSSATKSDKLRLFRNGMLQYGRVQQRRPVLPPERKDELCRRGAVSTDCFKSGDARVNEHPGLVAAHIVWLRQHNRMAQELAHLNPHWSDEKIYQETRKIVGAMLQHITYREFLPIVLGSEVMHRFELDLQKKGYYKEYNPKVNPSPASSFGSAAFRFGHSLVQSSMMRYDKFHRPMTNNVSLHMELTNPSNIWSIGAVDRLLLGMLNQHIQKRDEFITEELTNHLFQSPQGSFGMDLAAINIQRGRDHGVPPYTAWREPCGLSVVESFEDLFRVMPMRTAKKLMALYKDVNDIDLFTAGIAERPVVGGLVGPTFACIIAQQFVNLRKGDRFWYENGGTDASFTPAQLQQIRRISFAQVLCRTLDTIETVQPFAFLSTDNPDNDRISCKNGQLNNFDLSPWVELDSDSDNDIRKTEAEKPKRKVTTTSTTTRPTSTKRLTTAQPTTTSKNTVPKTNRPTNKNPSPIANKDTIKESKNKANTTDKLNTTTDTTNVTHDKVNKTSQNTDELNLTLPGDVTTLTKRPTRTTERTVTKHDIDDKLDFKNKSRRFEESKLDSRRRPSNRYDEYDYDDDDTQQVQSVVINNVAHKRPYRPSRPVIAVTENIDKYTYLINYVPRPTSRPTQSWRLTTRRPTSDRDVVKVTYQTYDDTYRRPNKPYYYNRPDNQNYRQNKPMDTTKDIFYSSARSNDETVTMKTKVTDKPDSMTESTTNLYKLVTFGYVGTYRNDLTDTDKKTNNEKDMTDKKTNNEKDMTDNNDSHIIKTDLRFTSNDSYKVTSNDSDKVTSNNSDKVTSNIFNKVTINDSDQVTAHNDMNITDRHDPNTSDDLKAMDLTDKNMKLSTFYLYETATKPYLSRPTRRNDEMTKQPVQTDKYYYVRNVLHKYKKDDVNQLDVPKKEMIKENYNNPGISDIKIENRSSVDKMAALEDIEEKPKTNAPHRQKDRVKPTTSKTPSINFEVLPSENSQSQWAIYEESVDLPEQYRMPVIKGDPYALKEIPRPMNLNNLRRRRPGLNKH